MQENMQAIIDKLHPLERKVFPLLQQIHDLHSLALKTNLQEVEVMRALQWLQNKELINIKEEIKEVITLDSNGKVYIEQGLPEKRFLKEIQQKPKTLQQIEQVGTITKEELQVSIGLLRKLQAITMEKQGSNVLVSITDTGKSYLQQQTKEEHFLKSLTVARETKTITQEEQIIYKELEKRKELIKTDVKKERTATLTDLGKQLAKQKITHEDYIDTITPELLKTGAWKNKKLRAYDVTSKVPQISGGKRHFENQTIEYVKQIWLDLGFEEMNGNMIQTAFWNLDCLFVPQDHPAREMQDTFYLKNPNKGKIPEKLKQKIKAVHENGDQTGSTGWQSSWSAEKAEELLLRTHTTVLSAQKLAQLKKDDLPKKYFNVGKVFRNEALDWKHLFEFYQVDGIVVDPHANFQNLLGYLKVFFKKMGYDEIRIRPAHFPYTEPSAEIEVFHPQKKHWVELGGCGILRPEVTTPLLGFPCPVLAWGFGLGRITCPHFNITDLRDLYKNDIRQLRELKIWNK